MKFRYYFLSFSLIMLAIYGLHFGYVYYFVENPFSWRITQAQYARSGSAQTWYIGALAGLMLCLHIPIFFASSYIAKHHQECDDVYFILVAKSIKYFFMFLIILFSSLHFSKWDYSTLKEFNDDYIDYMANNIKTSQVTFKGQFADNDPRNHEVTVRYAPALYIIFDGDDKRKSVTCDIEYGGFCRFSSREDIGKKFIISYFKHRYIAEDGNEYTRNYLFKKHGDDNLDVNHFTTLYKSQLKTLKSRRIAYLAIYLMVLLFQINLYVKEKRYVINH